MQRHTLPHTLHTDSDTQTIARALELTIDSLPSEMGSESVKRRASTVSTPSESCKKLFPRHPKESVRHTKGHGHLHIRSSQREVRTEIKISTTNTSVIFCLFLRRISIPSDRIPLQKQRRNRKPPLAIGRKHTTDTTVFLLFGSRWNGGPRAVVWSYNRRLIVHV